MDYSLPLSDICFAIFQNKKSGFLSTSDPFDFPSYIFLNPSIGGVFPPTWPTIYFVKQKKKKTEIYFSKTGHSNVSEFHSKEDKKNHNILPQFITENLRMNVKLSVRLNLLN